MQFKSGTHVWTWDRCYGRDGDPTPSSLNERVLVQFAHNVELSLDSLPRRRAGSTSILFGGVTFTNFVKLGRFFGRYELGGPIDEYLFWTDQAGRQLWARFTGSPTAAQAVAVPADGFSTDGLDTAYCQFNRKMYKAALSSVDRLHVMDPNDPDSPGAIRRVGIAAPAAPVVSDAGGVGPPTGGLRYYRVVAKVKTTPGTVTRRQSNLGTPGSINLASTLARVTQPTVSGDMFTHWTVYGSQDNLLYYNISGDLPVATTFWDDTIGPGAYPNFEAAPLEGTFNTWPSVKFLLNGIDRLIGFGAFGGTSTGPNVSLPGRVWFSPTLGTTSTEDDERVPVQPAGGNPIQNWIDVGRGTGQVDTGLGGPIDGNALVFQSRGIYLLVPTGNVYAPFKRVTVSTDVGAVEGSIFTGQDELGRPAVYFLDESAGPYRWTSTAGLQWLGFDLRDEWAAFNRSAPEFSRAHGVFHNGTHCAYFWITQGTTVGVGTPNRILKFNARLGKDTGPTGVRFGWTTESGDFATALGSVIIRRSNLGVSAATDTVFQPIASGATGATLLIRDPKQITDASVAYAASVRSKIIDLPGAPFQVRQLITDWLYLQAVRATTPMQVSLYRNYLDAAPAAMVRTLAPPLQAAETRVLIRYEGLLVQDAYALQVEISDQAAVAATATWDVDHLVLPIEVRTQERWNVS